MASYIDSRYYNYYGETDISNNKKQTIKIEKYMDDVANLMSKSYKGTDLKYTEKVNKFLNIFKVIINLEQGVSISDKRAREEFYKKEITKYAKTSGWDNSKIKNSIPNILKIQRL